MTKREKVGVGLVASPFVLLPCVILGYAIMGFFIKRAIETGAVLPYADILGRIASVLLGFMGVSAIVLFFIGIPVGIYLLAVPRKLKAK
jgi:hypothetical protein